MALFFAGCRGLGNSPNQPANVGPNQFSLTVSLGGTGQGTVTSNPAGINCGTTCSAAFTKDSAVALSAVANSGSSFAGWGGACSGMGACSVNLNSDQTVTASFTSTPTFALTVTLQGTGQGTVTSNPSGINCGTACTGNFQQGSQVTLTATASSGSAFGGWGGACTGANACTLTMNAAQAVTATFSTNPLGAINHIIFMAQENRGFEHYFGALGLYRLMHNYSTVTSPPGDIDGLTFSAACLAAPDPNSSICQALNTNPSAPPNTKTANCPPPNPNPTIQSFHLQTACVENPSPSWEESHIDVTAHGANDNWPKFWSSGPPYPMDGFVHTAAGDACANNFTDNIGMRAMGYYTDADLPYYYFMASNFGTSDRWFSPAMTRTQPNRMYLIGATSHGHMIDLQPGGTDSASGIPSMPIFQLLDQNHISWKIYVSDPLPGEQCADQAPGGDCVASSYLGKFAYARTPGVKAHVVSIAQYMTDVANGTLPQVAMIEGGYNSGRDEHPTVTPITGPGQGTNIGKGAQYVSTLINALMNSPSWKDSAFILTFDEFGGFYDHVPPQPTVNPDGIMPLLTPQDDPNNFANDQVKFNDDFTHTGYRVPLIVVSPFVKKNFVSHTVRDYTAILKFIETRFNLQPLTARDAAQDDMSEFFDFVNVPWATPPANVPVQQTNEACNPLP